MCEGMKDIASSAEVEKAIANRELGLSLNLAQQELRMPPEVSLSLLISERTCNCPAGKPLLSAPRGFYIQAMGILGRHATCPLARLDVTKLRPLGLPVIRLKFLTPPIPASNNLMMSSNQASFFLCGCNFNSCGNGLSVGFVASAVHLYLY